MSKQDLGIGVIGCGGFGLFALQHFTQIPGAKLIAMAGTHREAAYAAAQRFGIPEPMEVDEMVALPEVDLVYIATPPFLHHTQAMQALAAGKHVIAEKPLAMNLDEADEMLGLAREKGLLLIANLMQRYNPVYEAIKGLIDSKVLGELLHGYFENYANDEGLPAEHWFWDRAKSGGIFIEHGVHFFDLFTGWIGPGAVEAAQVSVRPGTAIEDQVQCTVRYRDDILVNFYHGFTQVGRMDRQEMRLLFELGDVTLYEWIPTLVTVRAVLDEKGTRDLCELFPNARLDVSVNYGPKDRACIGRHKPRDIYQKINLAHGLGDDKMHRYGELLRAVMADQLAWIRDPSHERRITEENGRASLAMAVAADALAH
ncbi:MAG: Gfo/Idh/MocA family oxidoreductase [Candidatus Hydrogenedentes bacterium]|nr:Gfo/Idh/MocA family oxidoreductase [Candidatus Hydrogenedentota bacterium]